MDEIKEVDALELGRMMLIWEDKGTDPLSVVELVKYRNAFSESWRAGVRDYVTGDLLMGGAEDGYKNRGQALKFIGDCWDKAALTFSDD